MLLLVYNTSCAPQMKYQLSYLNKSHFIIFIFHFLLYNAGPQKTSCMCRLKSYNDNIHVDIHYRLHIAELCKEHLPQSDRTDISWPQHLIYSGTDVGGGNAWLAVSVHLKGVRCSWGQVFSSPNWDVRYKQVIQCH